MELFLRTGSVVENLCGFRHAMYRHGDPSPNEIRRWVGQGRQEGAWSSVLSSHTREHYSSFGGLSTAVLDDLQVGTHKSKACLTGFFGTSCAVTRIFTHTNFKLCFLGAIGTKRYAYNFFFRHFQEMLTENPNLPNNLLMKDESQLHLPCAVNEQNFRYWSVANPHELLQILLHDSNFTVWCAAWSRGEIGPTYMRMKIDRPSQSQRSVTMIN